MSLSPLASKALPVTSLGCLHAVCGLAQRRSALLRDGHLGTTLLSSARLHRKVAPTGFPQSVRDEALELYREVGPAKAARQLGLESGTIRAWAHRAGITSTRVAYEWAEDGRTWPATMAAQDAARLRAQRRELAELTRRFGSFF